MGQYDPTTPSKFNAVSFFLVIALLAAGYAGAVYLPHAYPVWRLSREMQAVCYEAYRENDNEAIMKTLLSKAEMVGLDDVNVDHFELDRVMYDPGETQGLHHSKIRRGKEMWISFNYEVDGKWPFLEKYTHFTFSKTRHADYTKVEW